MMDLTDILFEYLSAQHRKELKTNKAYQAAGAAAKQAEDALCASLSPCQRQLLNSYIEKLTYKDSLELSCFFSNCSLLLVPHEK